MADATSSAAEIVNEKWDHSLVLIDAATEAVERFQEALNNSVYTPQTISADWELLPAPQLPEVGEVPEMPDIDLELPQDVPGPLTATMLDVEIDDFTEEAPEPDYGTAPVLSIGTAPTLPTLREVPVPDAPEIVMPDAPEFLTLTVHPAPSINLREEWLDKLDDVPTLTLLEPAQFAYSPGARYASQLLDNVKATLNANLAGGTGLSPQVEQAIWARALDRETTIALAQEQEVLRADEALGFPMPSGVLAGQLADARRGYYDKLSDLQREVAIKQSELEQANRVQTIQAVIQLELGLMDDAYKIEQLAFQAAKEVADNAIAVHNARITQFGALLDGYRTYASVYDTLIKAELSKVTLFEAMLKSEQTKADINQSLVGRYKAEIESRMASVEIYKARVGAAQTLVELERTRIQAGGEQIKAYVAQISGEQAKAELYKTRLEGEQIKAQIWGERVRAYGFKTSAKSEKARAEVAKFQALISAKALEWDGYKARLSAASAEVDAAASKSGMILNAYSASARAIEAKALNFTRRWEADIQQYQAITNITFQAAKINADAVQHANDARIEVAKVGYATSTQRLASASAMVGANAGISGSATLTQTI